MLPAGYAGAIGSRRTREERLCLRRAGIEAQQSALRSPHRPQPGSPYARETAVSITSEIIAHRNGASGLPLSLRTGPIHRPAAAETLPAAGTLIG